MFSLTAQCSSLTVNLVVTLRKFLSLLLSVVYFDNEFTAFHWLGTFLVFTGTLLFTDVLSSCYGYRSAIAVVSSSSSSEDGHCQCLSTSGDVNDNLTTGGLTVNTVRKRIIHHSVDDKEYISANRGSRDDDFIPCDTSDPQHMVIIGNETLDSCKKVSQNVADDADSQTVLTNDAVTDSSQLSSIDMSDEHSPQSHY